MADQEAVLVEVDGPKLVITLNRPEVLNAQNQAMRQGIVDALDRLEASEDLRVAILVGAGERAFSAGADLKELEELRSGGTFRPGALPPSRDPTQIHFERLKSVTKPVIAAIHGYAVGGGLEMALHCDLRVATESARLGQPEPRTVGGMAGVAVHHLPRLVPMGEALRILLTGAPISGRRAYEIGLVQEVGADREAMWAAAQALADEIVLCAPEAVYRTKILVRAARNMTSEQTEAMARAMALTRPR